MIDVIDGVRDAGEQGAGVPPATRWEQTTSGWEAQLGDARLWMQIQSGRYLSLVELDGTIYTERGFGLRIWAMLRAEEIARTGGRGGAFP